MFFKNSAEKSSKKNRHLKNSVEYLGGEVVFVNMQSMASTLDDYEWVEPPDTDDYVVVTPNELKVNRELIHKDLMKKLEEKRRRENDV